ncbi:unnamed protein product [Malus baccata var. baccata]
MNHGSSSVASPSPWKARVPPKVRVNFWKLCRDIVFRKVNLAVKHILCDLLCTMCSHYGESTIQLLRDCHFARCAWLSSSWEISLLIVSAFRTCDLSNFHSHLPWYLQLQSWWQDLVKCNTDLSGSGSNAHLPQKWSLPPRGV